MSIKSKIRTVKDYPIDGIMFRDITTLFKDPEGLREAINLFSDRYKDLKIDKIVAIESRGFLIGAPLAYLLNVGLVLIRKPGKLPNKTLSLIHIRRFRRSQIEIHTDAIEEGERVLIVDDLIATGGTVEAAVKLVQKMKADIIECCFIIDLPDFGGSKKLESMGQNVFSLCEFEGD